MMGKLAITLNIAGQKKKLLSLTHRHIKHRVKSRLALTFVFFQPRPRPELSKSTAQKWGNPSAKDNG